MRNIILLLCTFACSLGIAIAETPTQPEISEDTDGVDIDFALPSFLRRR